MKALIFAIALAICPFCTDAQTPLYNTIAVLTYENGREHRLIGNIGALPRADCEALRPRSLLLLMPYLQSNPHLVDGLVNVDVICVAAGEAA